MLRETVREIVAPQATAREWLALFATLAEHLTDPTTALARDHWHHPKLAAALQHAAAALDSAHPGGLHCHTHTPGRT